MRPSLVRPTLALLLVAGLALAVLAPAAAACPFCDGPGGANEVRREVFGPDFWPNLLAATAPFAVVLAVAAGVRYGGRR
jgi:hypothetical protein